MHISLGAWEEISIILSTVWGGFWEGFCGDLRLSVLENQDRSGSTQFRDRVVFFLFVFFPSHRVVRFCLVIQFNSVRL